MSEGFVPKGDKLHMMQPQRPGTFVAVTETGRIIEVVVLMDTKKVMTREWEPVAWDEATVSAENERVQSEMNKMQMQQSGGHPQAPRAPSGILKPGQVARPGTI
jgi:hypothetical protein